MWRVYPMVRLGCRRLFWLKLLGSMICGRRVYRVGRRFSFIAEIAPEDEEEGNGYGEADDDDCVHLCMAFSLRARAARLGVQVALLMGVQKPLWAGLMAF